MFKVNILLLGFIIGVELSLGLMVAPVIFNANTYLKENILNLLQSGILMSEIFVKFGYVLLFVCIFNFLYELFNLFKQNEKIKIKISKFLLSSIVLALSLLFVFYFMTYILQNQTLDSISSKEFYAMHSASEVSVKIMLLCQIFLFFLSFKIENKE